MFTGLISHIGLVKKIDVQPEDCIVRITAARSFIQGLKLGSSVCVNGVCLTVTHLTTTSFTVDISHETLDCTALNTICISSFVNLEHCLTLQQPLGGHLVSGHVMSTGVIKKMKPEGRSILMEISAPQKVMHYIAPKGCVAIDGVSMTVNRVSTSSFFINVIPHTFDKTIFQYQKAGDLVNLEPDMLMLYLDHLLKSNSADPESIWSPELLASWVHVSETEH